MGCRPRLRSKLINQNHWMIEREASARKNNNHNTERQGEMGGQMNWTISLQARAGQALSKTERMRE